MKTTPVLIAAILVGCAESSPTLVVQERVTGEAPPTFASEPAEAAPSLLINEVMSKNDSTLQLPDGSLPDWVELYNASEVDIDLGTVTLYDASEETWEGPEQMLAPGETFLVMSGEEGLPFNLDGSGDELVLSVDGQVVDRLKTGDLDGDVALARVPDGGTFAPTIWVSPGTSNPGMASPTLDPADAMFNHVTTISLIIEPAELAVLNSSTGLFGGNYKPEVIGTATFNGTVTFEGVGIKLKGSGSFEDLDGKPGWKLDLNDRHPGRRYKGLKKVTLNNGNHDPSYTHEYLSYHCFRSMGIPSPRIGFTHLYVNNEYYGLSINVESYDDAFLERHFTDATGVLGEGSSGGDFGDGDVDLLHFEELSPTSDTSALQEADRIITGPATARTYAELDQYINMDQFLTYAAVEALISHWDGYQSPNNWRFYSAPPPERIVWLPSGLDYTWSGRSGFLGLFGDNLWAGSGDVLQWCFTHDPCEERFNDKLLEVADMFESMEPEAFYQDLVGWVNPEIINDDNHSPESTWNEQEDTLDVIRGRAQHIRDEVHDRRN